MGAIACLWDCRTIFIKVCKLNQMFKYEKILSYYKKIFKKRLQRMSRRTRLRHTSHRFQLGRIHHNRYAQSSTYFPESYSTFGSPIQMPTRFMPLLQNETLHYICKEDELLDNQCPLFKLKHEELQKVKTANITICGKITNKVRKGVPNCVFVTGMVFCCLFALCDSDAYRRKFFTRYTMRLQEYQALGELISNLENCQNLIINIQDNDLTHDKMKLLTSAIGKSMGQNPEPDTAVENKNRKHVTIRNYCYYMRDFSTDNMLGKLSQFSNINAIFVWEKVVVYSGKRGNFEKTESQSLMMT